MVGGGSLFCGDWGWMDFKEVMLTSPPELAHRGGVGSTNVDKDFCMFEAFLRTVLARHAKRQFLHQQVWCQNYFTQKSA